MKIRILNGSPRKENTAAMGQAEGKYKTDDSGFL